MKVFQRTCCIILLGFFFLLGISAADKEYLFDSIVGICVSSNDRELFDQLRDSVEQAQCADIFELYQYIVEIFPCAKVSCGKRYYDETDINQDYVPAGVYNTIFVDINGNGDTESAFLKQIIPLSGCFLESKFISVSYVQKYYISFLSVLGKAEKLALELLYN